jgi:hypothetical protein
MQRAAEAVRQGQGVSAIFGNGDALQDDRGVDDNPDNGHGDPRRLNGSDSFAPELFIDEPASAAIAKK